MPYALSVACFPTLGDGQISVVGLGWRGEQNGWSVCISGGNLFRKPYCDPLHLKLSQCRSERKCMKHPFGKHSGIRMHTSLVLADEPLSRFTLTLSCTNTTNPNYSFFFSCQTHYNDNVRETLSPC